MDLNLTGNKQDIKVAVLMGGMSTEREVSLETGNAISGALGDLGYEVARIDVGLDLPAVLEREKPEAVFIALHGRGGEDGTVQGLLELMRIPYTGCGVLSSALTMDKVVTKQLISYNDIPVIEGIVARAGTDISNLGSLVETELAYPVMVKPASEGSSIATTKVEEPASLDKALDMVFEVDNKAIIERFIDGRLLTVGIVGDEPKILPVLEIKTKRDFYDYQAKYEPGYTEYEVPAVLEPDITAEAKKLSIKSYEILECEGMARIDLMLERSTGKLFVLEVNTIPGMTSSSLLPKAAAADGIPFMELVELILSGAKTKTHFVG